MILLLLIISNWIGCNDVSYINQSLTSVPNNITNATTSLNLANNEITEITNTTFAGLTNLKVLKLSQNRISEFGDTALQGIQLLELTLFSNQLINIPNLGDSKSSLQILRLSSNNIEQIEGGILDNLPELLMLNLEYNEITEISNTVFTSLPKLEILKLSQNKISVFGNKALYGIQLIELHLSFNQLTSIPNLGDSKPALQKLILTNNKITAIEAGVLDNMLELLELNLANNFLINVTLGNLSKLKYLYVNNNQLNQMPQLQSILPALTVLEIKNNDITSITVGYFISTPALMMLSLPFNKLTSFDAHYLSKLQHLNLKVNQLNSFPNISSCTGTLESLIINNNKENMQSMDLSLVFGNGGNLKPLDNLKELNMERNYNLGQDNTVINTLLSVCPNLESLHMSNINMNSFPQISHLTK